MIALRRGGMAALILGTLLVAEGTTVETSVHRAGLGLIILGSFLIGVGVCLATVR